MLKRIGDKNLVLRVARLTIVASQRQPRTRSEAEAEAKALICGESWALQRMGAVPEARLIAERSLALGESIDYARNTAFCKKCIGRMERLEAEDCQDAGKRAVLLEMSSRTLNEAINCFATLLGAEHPEVGDCYSLLGRTLLAKGELVAAQRAANEAYRLLTDPHDKDYLDLCILLGDIAAKQRDYDLAEGYFAEVIPTSPPSDNAELSEIFARAYFARANCRMSAGKRALAQSDFREAGRICAHLGDINQEKRAEWALIRLSGELPDSTIRLLNSETFPVRVAAYAIHNQKLSALSGSGLARRAASDATYWNRVIHDARERVAIEGMQR